MDIYNGIYNAYTFIIAKKGGISVKHNKDFINRFDGFVFSQPEDYTKGFLRNL